MPDRLRSLSAGRPSEAATPKDLATKLTRDLARTGTDAFVWQGINLLADGVVPGARAGVTVARMVVGALTAARSYIQGNGAALNVPVMINETTGFSLGLRYTFGAADAPDKTVELAAGLDPYEPPQPGVPVIEAPPSDPVEPAQVAPSRAPGIGERLGVRWLEDPPKSAMGVVVVAPRAEIRAATGACTVDADALKQYVREHAPPETLIDGAYSPLRFARIAQALDQNDQRRRQTDSRRAADETRKASTLLIIFPATSAA